MSLASRDGLKAFHVKKIFCIFNAGFLVWWLQFLKKNEFVLSLGICFKIFLFHIVFVLAFGLSFGGVGGNQAVSYQVGVNLDSSGSQWS